MLEVIVFCSGALVMILELVASRFLAPFLGTSLVVWTSLIGVVLAFLALGAWMGGMLADRKLAYSVLARILAGAGLAAAGVGLFAPFAAQGISVLIGDLRLATVCTATLLLALPATLYGMIAPYVVRLRLKDMASSGATVGRLSALGTAGSIAGTFLGGFVLIGWFGSTQILLGAGALTLALAVALYGMHKNLDKKKERQKGTEERVAKKAGSRGRAARRKGTVSDSESLFCGLMLLLLVLGAATTGNYAAGKMPDGSPALIHTAYNSIVLAEAEVGKRMMRTLSTDPGGSQSGIYVDDPDELAFAYTRFYTLGPALVPGATRILLLGGGACSIPRWLYGAHSPFPSEVRDHLRLDVVELDPGMTETARRYFGLPETPAMRIVHEDARRFLNTCNEQYDLVFVDLFNSAYSIPFHVITNEAVMALRQAVAPHGVLICNVIAALDGKDAGIFQAVYAAIERHFSAAYVFAVRSPRKRDIVQNLIIVALAECSPAQKAFLDDLPGPAQSGARAGQTDVSHLPFARLLSMRAAPPRPFPVFTDNYAPVERYAPVLSRR